MNRIARNFTSFFNAQTAAYDLAADLLAKAGVRINGNRPWDIQLKDPGVLDRALAQGNLGLGEAYMDGQWEAGQLDEFFFRLLNADLEHHISSPTLMFHAARARLFNLQGHKRAWKVGEFHYDLGNDFYAAMLDSRMTYTCGYWKQARNLDDAQEAKLDLVCRKLGLQPGMKVLDIGCGWGSFMTYAAEHYGVDCVGATISADQVNYGRELIKPGMPVSFVLKDYRDLDQSFDRIVSLGMMEHVGRKNYKEYMRVAHRCLKGNGLFLLHTIGKKEASTAPDPWIDRYIFPNGDIPALSQIAAAAEDRFVIEDLHNFGADYDKTLMAWHDNFEAAWPQFSEQYGERFYRMWRYYLLSCAGSFRARHIQLWQIVLAKKGVKGGYQRVS
ncbi:MAG: cyclopropane fatty acyl phospholipid synthase [Oleiphilaceae bacterium]|nr:cyclopropane fatty acyl phospholipid synthase [Oleiphilaceae bacterium]